MKLNTVNVIQLDCDGLPISLVSFDESDEGNREAESLFQSLVKEGTEKGIDMESAIEDGYAEIPGGGHVVITHSAI